MARTLGIACVLYFSAFLSACGGGSSADSEESSSSNDSINQTLKQKYSDLASSRYTGQNALADMASAPGAIKLFALSLMQSVESQVPPIPSAILNQVGTLSYDQLPRDIATQHQCEVDGTADVSGTLSVEFNGQFKINYQNCEINELILNGSVILGVNAPNLSSYTVFYDNLEATVASGDGGRRFSGYAEIIGPSNNSEFGSRLLKLDLLTSYLNSDNQTLNRTTRVFDPINSIHEGTISESGYGRVRLVESSNDFTAVWFFTNGRFEFEGANNQIAKIEFVNSNLVKLLLDSAGDGELDSGYFFRSIEQFFNSDFSTLQLLPIDQLGFAPEVESPRLLTDSPNATKELVIEPGTFFDRDTGSEDLDVSYQWWVNDTIVPSVTGTSMASGIAFYGDEVSVIQRVSDGQNVGTSAPLTFDMEDAPSTVKTNGLPTNVESGQTVSFSAMVFDPDVQGSEPAKLIFGPAGMGIDQDGMITWTVPKPLFNQTEVRFGLGASDEKAETIGEFSVTVSDPEATLPIARSGIEVPLVNHAIHIADFLDDGDNEIVMLGDSMLFALQNRDNGVEQIWAYPFHLPTDGQLRALQVSNVDSDSKKELIVATEKGISVIYDHLSLAQTLWETDQVIHAMKVSDLSADGVPELIVAHGPSRYEPGVNLTVFEITDPSQPLLNISLSGGIADIAIANLDTDDQKEIVLNSGYVFDGETFENQWYFGSAFGDRHVSTGDIDGDGTEEIIAGDEFGGLYVYSFDNRSLLHSQTDGGGAALKTVNIDADAASEVISADRYNHTLTAFDWQGNSLAQKWRFDDQPFNLTSVEVGDSDNDGSLELVWGKGQGNSVSDSLVIATDLGENPPEFDLPEAATVQLDSYSAAGWGNITPDQEQAVFVIPQTNSGNAGKRLALLDPDGNLSLTNEIGEGRVSSPYGQVTDFDLDGYADIYIQSLENGAFSFQALRLDDLSTQWSANIDRVSVIGSAQLNGDAFPDALFSDERRLNLVDVKNSALITNIVAGGTISDFDHTAVSGGDEFIVTATEFAGIEVWKKQADVFSRLAMRDEDCDRVVFVNADSDAKPELVCSQSRYYLGPTEIAVFDLEPSLPEINRIPVGGKVTDLSVDSRQQNQQSIIVGVNEAIDGNTIVSQIKEFDLASGQEIWSSPEFLGEISHRSIHYRPEVSGDKSRLMFSTDEAMYLVK